MARWLKWALLALAVLVAFVGAGLWVTWDRFFRSAPQDLACTPDELADDPACVEHRRFMYGSLGAELVAGLPYPIFMIMPRVFPDLLPRHGGWGAFGLAWEEGQRLPAGLSIKRAGFERVTLTCALCHTTSWRLEPDDNPSFAIGGPGHTVDVQAALRFLFAAANDRRFTGARMVPELTLHFGFDWLDKVLYGFVIIPKTRWALRLAERQFAWMDSRPDWGPGRDDAFNLPKFILTRAPEDGTVGNTDFPALWRMGGRDGHLVHWGGEAPSVAAVIATSGLGLGSLPHGEFTERNAWLEAFMRELEPPPWPKPLDAALAQRGGAVFAERCAVCHAPDGERVGTAIPLGEIGTDPEHVRTWSQANADRMNELTRRLGMADAELRGAQGYVARPLVGVWLLAPYLHNGSVPTLADLLEPPGARPKLFWRGYDLVDTANVGFVSSGSEAEALGFRHDTALPGNGNGGHAYGTDLPDADKRALIEYLKTL